MQTLEIKTMLSEMKNSFNGLIKRLNTTEERISELENRLINIKLTYKEKEKKTVGGKKVEQAYKRYEAI